jgi:hypothetical protein
MALSKEATVEQLIQKYACETKKWLGDEGFIPTELCIPGAQVRAVRLQGLQKILSSINSGAGWIHSPIIVEAKKMKHAGSKATKLWYRVIDGMHRVTVAKQLLAAGNQARSKVATHFVV